MTTDYLNDIYPQDAAPTETMNKQAQFELFSKLAADNDIELEHLSPEQVSELWDSTMKVAMDEEEEKEKKEEKKEDKGGKGNLPPSFLKNIKGKGKGDDEDKEASALETAALAEHADKVASANKLAEAAQMGEVMAHSFVAKVAELEAAATEATPEETTETTEETPAEEAPKVASAGGASALDILAAKGAVAMAKEAGYNAEEIAHRVNAVLILGAPESTKIAHIQDAGAAVQVRSLELLEAAGVEVNWDEVQS